MASINFDLRALSCHFWPGAIGAWWLY